MLNKKCFVIGPIGGENSDERRHANDLFDHIIKPVVGSEEFGYAVSRADKLQTPGQITTQVIQAVKEADLVIADLSFRNPNAFYELSLRHALGTPVIHMIRSEDDIPFDVHAYRAIKFGFHIGLAERAKGELAGQLRSIQDFKPQNPIFDTLGKIDLERSGDPEAQLQAHLMDVMIDVRHELRSLKREFHNQSIQNRISIEGAAWDAIGASFDGRLNEQSNERLHEIVAEFDEEIRRKQQAGDQK